MEVLIALLASAVLLLVYGYEKKRIRLWKPLFFVVFAFVFPTFIFVCRNGFKNYWLEVGRPVSLVLFIIFVLEAFYYMWCKEKRQ